MIYLKKGQTLFDNPGMVVYDPTGYYDDGTSVICAPVFAPEEAACRYEAKYIAYGGIVYSISNEEELLKQILELDPQSLFGKDSKQVAVDKVADAIVTQGTTQVTDEVSEIKEEKEEEKEEEPEQTTEAPTTTPPTDILSNNTSTTTPTQIDTGTTTPTIDIPQTPEAPASTTPVVDLPPTTIPPEELLPVDTSSSTPVMDIPPAEIIQTENTASSSVTQ